MANPAERLLNILEAGKDVSRSNGCRDTWMSLLNVEEDNESLLLSRLGKTMALVDQAVSELDQIDSIDSSRYTPWVSSVHQAFSQQNLNSQWETFSKHLNQHTFNYLSNASDILNAYSNEPTWDLDELSDISSTLSDLVEEINNGDFSDHVRAYMTAKLREIQIAIEEYEITGGGPISEAVDSAFGRLLFDGELRAAAQSTDSAKKFWRLMNRLLLITTLSLNIAQLPSAVQDVLPISNSAKAQASDSVQVEKKDG